MLAQCCKNGLSYLAFLSLMYLPVTHFSLVFVCHVNFFLCFQALPAVAQPDIDGKLDIEKLALCHFFSSTIQ